MVEAVLRFAPVIIPLSILAYLAAGLGWLAYDAWMSSKGYWRPPPHDRLYQDGTWAKNWRPLISERKP